MQLEKNNRLFEDPAFDGAVFECMLEHADLPQLPESMTRALRQRIASVYRSSGYGAASGVLKQFIEAATSEHALAFSDRESITARAHEIAKHQTQILGLGAGTFDKKTGKPLPGRIALEHLFAEHQYGIRIPHRDAEKALIQITAPLWWKRQLWKKARQSREMLMYTLKSVGKNAAALYSSDTAVGEYRATKIRQQEWLENTSIEDESGNRFCLKDVVFSTEKRFAESLCVMSGIEQLATQRELAASFITLTTPSEYHINPKHGKGRWDGSTPADAIAWLNVRWQRTRAGWSDNSVAVAGCWVSEPHQDGTPHRHMLVFHEREQTDRLDAVLRSHFGVGQLSRPTDDKDVRWNTPGLQIVSINPQRGKASSYIYKYLQKSKGFDAEKKELQIDERASAWRSIWGSRSLQWFGVQNRLGVWRELRMLKENPGGEIAKAWKAAHDSDFAEFMSVIGDTPVSLVKELRETASGGYKKTIGLCDTSTGEAWLKTQYRLVIEKQATFLSEPISTVNYSCPSAPSALCGPAVLETPPAADLLEKQVTEALSRCPSLNKVKIWHRPIKIGDRWHVEPHPI